MTLKQTRFELGLLIIHAFLSQLFDATDNLKTNRATHWFLDLSKSFTELKSGDKNLFLRKYFVTIFIFNGNAGMNSAQ